MELFLFIIIGFIILIIILLFLKKNNYESFDNKDSNTETDSSYLYPVKNLSGICRAQGLKPSYMPKACYVDGKMNTYANCKCEDEKGNCKICYPIIKKDSKNSSVVYNATFS